MEPTSHLEANPCRLDQLALALEALRPVASPPAWAEIIGPPDDPGPVRWHDGLEGMFGFVAPCECAAVAVVANGWGRGLESGPPGSITILEPGERRRIRVVCVVTRDGRVAGHVRAGTELLLDKPPGAGRVLDCLLRCFQLPTAPPVGRTDPVLATMWLANVQHSAERRPGRLTWPEVAAMHPAMQVLDMAGEAISVDQIPGALRAAARAWDWDYLLDQARTAGFMSDVLAPGTAEWMDQGMFSRWVEDSWPAASGLVAAVTQLLAPGVARRLRRTLDALGVAADDQGAWAQ